MNRTLVPEIATTASPVFRIRGVVALLATYIREQLILQDFQLTCIPACVTNWASDVIKVAFLQREGHILLKVVCPILLLWQNEL